MERFTSRRQHSDSNLHRMLSYAWSHTSVSNTNSLNQKKLISGSMDESIRVQDRRSFKWRSLFSTSKNNSCLNSTKISSPEILNLKKNSRQFSPGRASNKLALGLNSSELEPLFEDFSITDDETQKYKNQTRRNSATVVFRQTTESSHPFNRHSFQSKSSIKSPPILQKQEKKIFQKSYNLNTTRPFSVIGVEDFENLIGSALSEYCITDNNNRKLIEFVQLHEKVKTEKATEKLENSDSIEDNLNENYSNKIQQKLEINSKMKNPEVFINQQCVNKEKFKRYNYYNNCNSLKYKRSIGTTGTINRRATTAITNIPSIRPFSPISFTESGLVAPPLVSVGRIRKKRALRRQSIHANMILNTNESITKSLESSSPHEKSMVALRAKKKSKTQSDLLSTTNEEERCVVFYNLLFYRFIFTFFLPEN